MEQLKINKSSLYLNNEKILGIEGFVNVKHVMIREKSNLFIFILVNLFLFLKNEKIIISKLFYFILILCILINLIINIYYYKISKNYKKEVKVELIINSIFKISYILIIISLFIKSYYELLLIVPNILVVLYSVLFIKFEFIFIDINFKVFMSIQVLLFKLHTYIKIFSYNFILLPTILIIVYFIINLILYIVMAFICLFSKTDKPSFKIFFYLSIYYIWCISQVFILYYIILNYFDKTKYYLNIQILSSANILLLFLIIFLFKIWNGEVKNFNEILYYSSLEKKIKLINFDSSQEKIFYKLSSNYLSYTNNKENENKNCTDLKEKIDSIPNNSLCIGCFDKKPKIVIDPCNHLVFCISCLKNFIIYNKEECPICKIIINKYHKVKSISDNRYKLNGQIKVN